MKPHQLGEGHPDTPSHTNDGGEHRTGLGCAEHKLFVVKRYPVETVKVQWVGHEALPLVSFARLYSTNHAEISREGGQRP